MTIIFLIGLALLLWGLYPLGVILLYSPYRKAKIDELNVSIEPRQESRLYIMCGGILGYCVLLIHCKWAYLLRKTRRLFRCFEVSESTAVYSFAAP
jgi:hypothetical protein